MSHIQAVIFDLDGVICDTAHFHFIAWKRLADHLGIAFSETDNEQMKGVDRLNSLEMILKLGGQQRSAAEKQALCDRKNADYQTLIAEMSPADVFPGVQDILATLKVRDISVGVASASKNAPAILQRLGLDRAFAYVADSSLIKNNKPDPEIFLTVAAALEVAPAHCVGIEDAAAGVTAIKAAGMRAIGIGDAEVLHQADMIFPTTDKIDLIRMLS
ncbi:beta-phosphoglucomutase [Paremcibacter congregatus]|uniref:Beta-phosphoglucomutase n=1 Tax=Paremcibacter congregatus TaxID=2043170 RepID=A0A2G4YVP5_9PROT|nr:beta-phosphoglucomutase [Paremcibacter congregatus]PHZ86397.1 beta-phosphoglucomutase [Paremcibacter congregatus]QDE28508.1 beta-phosphoglucomutase [Paremcibacter congregatus]